MFLNKFELEISLIKQKSIIIYAKRKRFEAFVLRECVYCWKIYNSCVWVFGTCRKTSIWRAVSQRAQINLIFPTIYVYCIYPAMWKRQKQLQNLLKRAEIVVILIVFKSTLCRVLAYSTVCSTYIRVTVKLYYLYD
jgi:hypothetical protein